MKYVVYQETIRKGSNLGGTVDAFDSLDKAKEYAEYVAWHTSLSRSDREGSYIYIVESEVYRDDDGYESYDEENVISEYMINGVLCEKG